MRSRTIELDGPLHFADFGGSGRTMVLVHGLGGSHANWMAVGAALAGHARVVAPDLAGFGRTPLAGRSADVHANRRVLDRFLDTVADGPAILVGNSMGGLIAMMEAARRPAKVAGLVLVGPAQPRPPATLVDPMVALTFAAYALPGLGETFMRWRAARLGPEGTVRQTLALCCTDPARLLPDVVAAHVAMARERQAMPWAQAAFLARASATSRNSKRQSGSSRRSRRGSNTHRPALREATVREHPFPVPVVTPRRVPCRPRGGQLRRGTDRPAGSAVTESRCLDHLGH